MINLVKINNVYCYLIQDKSLRILMHIKTIYIPITINWSYNGIV